MPLALLCHGYSDDPLLTIADLPSATLRDGEVRVQVRAAGLNFHDTLMIRGR